jgi:hypothetical protein
VPTAFFALSDGKMAGACTPMFYLAGGRDPKSFFNRFACF